MFGGSQITSCFGDRKSTDAAHEQRKKFVKRVALLPDHERKIERQRVFLGSEVGGTVGRWENCRAKQRGQHVLSLIVIGRRAFEKFISLYH